AGHEVAGEQRSAGDFDGAHGNTRARAGVDGNHQVPVHLQRAAVDIDRAVADIRTCRRAGAPTPAVGQVIHVDRAGTKGEQAGAVAGNAAAVAAGRHADDQVVDEGIDHTAGEVVGARSVLVAAA